MANERQITYAQAIHEALDFSLKENPFAFIIGEGVPDPKGIFGTTAGLQKKYGKDRVMDMPVSENALTGICIGAALRGFRPIMVHQRVDFCLLALDQIVNNAAKWYFMFAGQASVPMVIRLVVGRGWGQGAQHSQSFQALFAHIPGLKVIMPATAYDAKGLMIEAVKDNNPVIFIEHRWLHNTTGHVPEGGYRVALGKANVIRPGKDFTIVASSHMTIEALKAASVLSKNGVDAEVIDLRTIKPLDGDTIIQSVKKTKHLLVVDGSWLTGGITAEIITCAVEGSFGDFRKPPRRLALPDMPVPSSPGLAKNFYPGYREIIENVFNILDVRMDIDALIKKENIKDQPSDVPDLSFKGPF